MRVLLVKRSLHCVNCSVVLSAGMSANGTFCAYILNEATLSMECNDKTATIDKILFASYGTVQGSCGNYSVGSCNAANSTDIVKSACLGKRSCTIDADTPLFGDPCFGTVKHLAVEAHCSTGQGTGTGGQASNVYAQGFTAPDGSNHRLLLVNKTPSAQSVMVKGAAGDTAIIVDDTRPTGPAINIKLTSDVIEMRPYAVFIILLQ